MHKKDSMRDFHHPYAPYDIQVDFMNAVYNCLDNGKVGIFESPTGTGKSLSLICGSLTWLRDYQDRSLDGKISIDANKTNEPSWMLEHAQKQNKREALHLKVALNERLSKIRAKERRDSERLGDKTRPFKRLKAASNDAQNCNEDHFVLDDYSSDSGEGQSANSTDHGNSGLSKETQALMHALGLDQNGTSPEHRDPFDETRIIFSSRTHSQLTQFATELSRVKMPANTASSVEAGVRDEDFLVEEVKYLTLGSRKNLCINSKVNGLSSAAAINERCIELQQTTKPDDRCPFMPNNENQNLQSDFRDHALARIRDIEDLGVLGKKIGICPYYATRSAAPFSEMIALPYPLLLQKSAREALGISLKNHIVIIDEAHNLMDAIAGIYSVSITLEQANEARTQLTIYLQKFRSRLKGKNRVYVAQLIRILDSLITYLRSVSGYSNGADGLANIATIMTGKGVDQIDIFKLNAYLQNSRLARKVDGYTSYRETAADVNPALTTPNTPVEKTRRQSAPVLMHVQSFLLSLMNPSSEGRFFYSKEEDDVVLRYLLLDPTFHFRDIVDEAKAIILAGGTMSPMSDYKHHLLPYVNPGRLMTLSCGHVIPKENLVAIPMIKGQDGLDLDFTFGNRNKAATVSNLGATICSLAQHIPDGLVVFFPSYSYLDTCIAAWQHNMLPTQKTTIWDSLTQIKPIFLEQRGGRSKSAQDSMDKDTAVKSVLTSYSAAIATGNGRGALLFAVVGGTLSEGINFSDALGRGVVVVGLPFPNPRSAEWQAKMQYITKKEDSDGRDGKAAAKDFFENACMRAVNQCVGRAIRHKGDYAAIITIDRRYGTRRIQDKLPGWIRGSLTMPFDLHKSQNQLDRFFSLER